MTWVFTDDHVNENEQVCNAGGAAAWYHVCGHAFCRRKEPARRAANERLDFIPMAAASGLFPPYTTTQARAAIAALVRVRLWRPVDGGYLIADWQQTYGDGSSRPAAPPTAGPAGTQPTPSQLGGQARASQASRGPAGTFQPRSSRLVQPSQPRARQDPDPVPDLSNKNTAAKEPEVSTREAPLDQPKPAATAAAGTSRELPSNLEQALELTICARAEVAVTHPERAEWLQPQKWPEVLKVATALHEACGLGEVRLSVYGRDSGVRAIVELFAAGYMPSDLVKAARLLPSDPWWSKEGSRRGLASLSAEVVRRVLATGLSPAQEARVARALGERPPSALGSILPTIPAAAGGDT